MILALDEILCITLSTLCQHLEEIMTLYTEMYFMIHWSQKVLNNSYLGLWF